MKVLGQLLVFSSIIVAVDMVPVVASWSLLRAAGIGAAIIALMIYGVVLIRRSRSKAGS